MHRLNGIAAAAALSLTAAAPAHAYDPLEGLWGPHGEMKIEARPDGTLRATNITGLFNCEPSDQPGFFKPMVGEVFTVRAAEPQTYVGSAPLFETLTCAPAGRGDTLLTLTGNTYRRCTSNNPVLSVRLDDNQQPIWPTVCETASRYAPPIPPARIQDAVRPLPSTRRCRSRRNFRIHLRNPRQDPLVSAEVRVNGRPVAVQQAERATAPVDLRGLPRGRYSVTIRVSTATGRTLQQTRRYRTCTPRGRA